ncbi:MAG: rRNA maturation RNase YbeY [Actinomycetota bacterium]
MNDGGVEITASDARSEDEIHLLPVDLDRWADLARSALRSEQVVGVLGLTLVDRAEIAELNAEHMGAVGPTDVLSFPIDDPDEAVAGVPTLLGDVVLSPAVAHDQFAAHAGSFDDEIALLVVHGVLHVLGHDHADEAETARMRRRERELLEAHHWGQAAPAGFRHDHTDS